MARLKEDRADRSLREPAWDRALPAYVLLPGSHPMIILRLAKIALVAAVAAFLSLVAIDNLTDYNSNYQFVAHVLSMDTTFPGNQEMWRAIHSPAVYGAFYATIITWEFAAAILCWWGCVRCLRAIKADVWEFDRAKVIASAGLTLSLLQWFFAFLTVGGEWFLMWQSKIWNGQDAAFRMFTTIGIILLFLNSRERDPLEL